MLNFRWAAGETMAFACHWDIDSNTPLCAWPNDLEINKASWTFERMWFGQGDSSSKIPEEVTVFLWPTPYSFFPLYKSQNSPLHIAIPSASFIAHRSPKRSSSMIPEQSLLVKRWDHAAANPKWPMTWFRTTLFWWTIWTSKGGRKWLVFSHLQTNTPSLKLSSVETGDLWWGSMKIKISPCFCAMFVPDLEEFPKILPRPWPPESCCSSHSTANLRPMAC